MPGSSGAAGHKTVWLRAKHPRSSCQLSAEVLSATGVQLCRRLRMPVPCPFWEAGAIRRSHTHTAAATSTLIASWGAGTGLAAAPGRGQHCPAGAPGGAAGGQPAGAAKPVLCKFLYIGFFCHHVCAVGVVHMLCRILASAGAGDGHWAVSGHGCPACGVPACPCEAAS